jgi:hypothetical protein
MSVVVAHNAELLYTLASGGTATKLANVRDVRLEIRKDALETTVIGDTDRSYVAGIRATSGSGTLVYRSTDTLGRTLLNQILNGDQKDGKLTLNADNTAGRFSNLEIVLTAVGMEVSAGDLVACSFDFQVSGKPNSGF